MDWLEQLIRTLWNGISWNACAAISPDRRYPLNVWRRPATVAYLHPVASIERW